MYTRRDEKHGCRDEKGMENIWVSVVPTTAVILSPSRIMYPPVERLSRVDVSTDSKTCSSQDKRSIITNPYYKQLLVWY